MRRRTREILVWIILLITFVWLAFYIISSFFLAGLKETAASETFIVMKDVLLSEITITVGFSLLGLLALTLVIDKIVEKNSS